MRGSWSRTSLGRRVGCCALVAIALPAAAQRPTPGTIDPSGLQGLYDSWQKRQDAIVAALSERDAGADQCARTEALALIQDVVDHSIGGAPVRMTAGRALIVLAIAEVRLGDRDAGSWHWQLAQNVSPELRAFSFRDYPDVADFMKANLTPDGPSVPFWPRFPREVVANPSGSPNVEPPTLVRPVAPEYPAKLRGQRIAGETVVDALIDEEGKVREAVVKRGSGNAWLDQAAVDAVRQWRYAPATIKGRPVKVNLTVTIAFNKHP